jgi:NDP-sugar pyrophosphorylase family protein
MPTLVVLAAGVGRRYGGSKQLVGLGPGGELLLEYDLFDALRAGFDRAVLVVRPEQEPLFRARLADGAGRRVGIAYARQPEPRGTADAVLAARGQVTGPFAVANADDVYGPGAFRALARGMRQAPDAWTLVAYDLARTLSPGGPVARALLRTAPDGSLLGLEEHGAVQGGTGRVSMNLWGFTPDLFDGLAALAQGRGDAAGGEFLLPEAVGALVLAGRARVRVVDTDERWLGVTWPADRAWVEMGLREAVRDGRYPSPLWGAA